MNAHVSGPEFLYFYLAATIARLAAVIAMRVWCRGAHVDASEIERLHPEVLAALVRSPRACIVAALIALVARGAVEIVADRPRVASHTYPLSRLGETDLERRILEWLAALADERLETLVAAMTPDAQRSLDALGGGPLVRDRARRPRRHPRHRVAGRARRRHRLRSLRRDGRRRWLARAETDLVHALLDGGATELLDAPTLARCRAMLARKHASLARRRA